MKFNKKIEVLKKNINTILLDKKNYLDILFQ